MTELTEADAVRTLQLVRFVAISTVAEQSRSFWKLTDETTDRENPEYQDALRRRRAMLEELNTLAKELWP